MKVYRQIISLQFQWQAVILIMVMLAACGGSAPSATSEIAASPSVNVQPTNSPTSAFTQTPYVITATSVPLTGPRNLFILSMQDNGFAHLFAFSPQDSSLTRLTSNPWDDVTPSLSPDGNVIAFSSRQNGYWDLYLLDLNTGEKTRLTDTLEYESSPSWSPDGRWLVFESYFEGNLNLEILSVQEPLQRQPLTIDPSADHSPDWSPLGRQIAFVSNRTGENEIWIADLDKIDTERFFNISQDPQSQQAHPAWSPDGQKIVWASSGGSVGMEGIYLWNGLPGENPYWLGSGDCPIWDQQGEGVFTSLIGPNDTFLAEINLTGASSTTLTKLHGDLLGMDYGFTNLPATLPLSLQVSAEKSPTPLLETITTLLPNASLQTKNLVTIKDIQAPYPRLLDDLDESFVSLRKRVAEDAGWDALASLENAFVPISVPLSPGLGEDWLYTGRAFSLNPILLDAGWMSLVKEEINQQTYWRVFLRTRAQDGSQGTPLHQIPWDIRSRFSGTPQAYDQGGQSSASIPKGFWIDLTALASAYGWERFPALSNWVTNINASRYNQFVQTTNLNWQTAMLQVYPPEIFITPSQVLPPTLTPSKTPWRYRTPTPTFTLTPRPTLTPLP